MDVKALGMLWFKDDIQYLKYQIIFTDKYVLSDSYVEWHRDAITIIKLYKDNGVKIFKAYAEPEEFVTWCFLNGKTLDSEGRMAFSRAKASDDLTGSILN